LRCITWTRLEGLVSTKRKEKEEKLTSVIRTCLGSKIYTALKHVKRDVGLSSRIMLANGWMRIERT
jgi:hypothetical protein